MTTTLLFGWNTKEAKRTINGSRICGSTRISERYRKTSTSGLKQTMSRKRKVHESSECCYERNAAGHRVSETGFIFSKYKLYKFLKNPQLMQNPRSNKSRDQTKVMNSPIKIRRVAYLEVQLETKEILAFQDSGCEQSVIGRNLI